MGRKETMLSEFKELGYGVKDSSQYSTVSSVMDLLCKKGHSLRGSLHDVRKVSFVCSECQKEKYGGQIGELAEKRGLRIVSIDAATENLGLALFEDARLVAYQLAQVSGKHTLIQRLSMIRTFIEDFAFGTWNADYLVLENIQFQQYKGTDGHKNVQYYMAFKSLAMLQGVLLEVAESNKVEHTLIPVNKWRSQFGISSSNRSTAKKQAIETVKKLYSIDTNDDVAEAILMGAWASDQIREQKRKKLF